ncbi:ABC transporter permease [Kitasatospora sp. NPDC093550]|uniref:ABC transporter permease n=1 Tax=Kitasatospora sp. NPDC093550 TaxID=3364089 RepID=UPI0038137BA4
MIRAFTSGLVAQLRISSMTPLAIVSAVLSPMVYGILVVSSGSAPDIGLTLGIAAAGIWTTTLTSALFAVLEERRSRTLQLLVTVPASMAWPLLGRVLGGAVQGLTAVPASAVTVSLIWGVPEMGDPVVLLGALVLVTAGCTAMSAFLVGFLVRYRFFAGMVNGFFGLVTFLTGMFVPVSALQPFGRYLAELLPPTWGMSAVRDQSYSELGIGCLVLLVWLVAALSYLSGAERRVRKISSAFFA